MINKKKLLLIGGGLALSAFLFMYAFSHLSPSETQSKEITLRGETKDLSISDILNSTSSKKIPEREESAPAFINNNTPSEEGNLSDDPESVSRVQALIRANEENIVSGIQEINDNRREVIDEEPELPVSKQKKRRQEKEDLLTESPELPTPADNEEVKVKVETVKPSPFHTIAMKRSSNKNAIKAYVHSEQVVMAGSTLKMRLGENAYTDNGTLIPNNSPIYGIVTSIDGERVNVCITNINVNGNILPFEKQVYSKDALLGIYVPGNPKAETTKDAAGGALDGIPTSGIPGLDAATKIAGVVASSAASAGKQAISKNVKKIKVTIKTNYEIFLRPDEKK